MRRIRTGSPGFTLIEALISTAIIGLVFGIVVAVLITSMRVWRKCSSESQAFPPAYQLVTQLNNELKNAYYISIPTNSTSITFRTPKTDANGVNIVPFVLGHEITYYRSDATGSMTATGTFLWRKDKNGVSNVTTQRNIAQNVSQLTFNCSGTLSGRVFAVYSMSVTVVGQEQATTYNSTFSSTMAIRNPTSGT